MEKKYEITVKVLEEYIPEEERDVMKGRNYPLEIYPSMRFSDKNFHEIRAMHALLTEDEFKKLKAETIKIFE